MKTAEIKQRTEMAQSQLSMALERHYDATLARENAQEQIIALRTLIAEQQRFLVKPTDKDELKPKVEAVK